MRNGLHLALIQRKGGFQKGLAVARGACTHDARPLGHGFLQTRHGTHGGMYRIAAVVLIIGEEQFAVRADERELGGGGACINAEEAVAAICGKITACNMRPLVSAAECGIFVLIGKQGGQALDLGFGGDPGA